MNELCPKKENLQFERIQQNNSKIELNSDRRVLVWDKNLNRISVYMILR